MLYEKRKLIIYKIVVSVVLLTCVIVPLCLRFAPAKTANIVDDEGYCDYNDSLNSSDVEIYVKFDKKVESGYITVKFYGKNKETLATVRRYFFKTDDDKEVSATFYIKGNVKSYEIISSEITRASYIPGNIVSILIVFDIFLFIILLWTLSLSCKVYDLNEKELVVYAGFYHHYIKYDGTILDEHNTFQTYVPIYLSTTLDDGTYIEATISTLNRVSLKVNDKLYTKYK